MNKKIGVSLIIVVLAAVVFVSGCTQQGNNTTQNNTTVQQNMSNTTNTSAKAVDVVATQSGPTTAKKGDNVTITYNVANKGNEAVYNVKIVSQEFEQTIGTLEPGKNKTVTHQIHIPTDQEIQQDTKPNATVSNPLPLSFVVIFTDSGSARHTVQSNTMEIKLV